jgi:hypothetical protein
MYNNVCYLIQAVVTYSVKVRNGSQYIEDVKLYLVYCMVVVMCALTYMHTRVHVCVNSYRQVITIYYVSVLVYYVYWSFFSLTSLNWQTTLCVNMWALTCM